MLNKDNYIPWSSRLLRYAKSKPNGKLIYNSTMHDLYVRQMIPEPGDPDREVPVAETFHEQTDDELTDKDVKQICETAHEIWLLVQQMMKGSDIEIQEKKAKLFNEWERFTSTDGESIESYYHHFSKLMNDFKRNKHFPEKIASNLKAERLARAHDPLALMANSNNLYNYPVFHQDQPSQITYMQQPLPNNNFIPQPSFNRNYMQQLMLNLEDISDPTTKMNMALIAQPGINLSQDRKMLLIRGNGRNQFRQYARQNVGNQNGYNAVQNVRNQNVNQNGNDNVVATQAKGNGNGNGNNGNQEEAGIQLQAEEFDLMAAAGYRDKIE
ncbi:hypothetical protein Tco_0425999 [Tanacetum coccineum]